MFGLSTSQWYENGEVGVKENPQAIMSSKAVGGARGFDRVPVEE